MSTVECGNCKGKGHTLDRQCSRQRFYREVKRKCRFCKGEGVIVRDDRPLWQRQAEEDDGTPRPDMNEVIRLIYGKQ